MCFTWEAVRLAGGAESRGGSGWGVDWCDGSVSKSTPVWNGCRRRADVASERGRGNASTEEIGWLRTLVFIRRLDAWAIPRPDGTFTTRSPSLIRAPRFAEAGKRRFPVLGDRTLLDRLPGGFLRSLPVPSGRYCYRSGFFARRSAEGLQPFRQLKAIVRETRSVTGAEARRRAHHPAPSCSVRGSSEPCDLPPGHRPVAIRRSCRRDPPGPCHAQHDRAFPAPVRVNSDRNCHTLRERANVAGRTTSTPTLAPSSLISPISPSKYQDRHTTTTRSLEKCRSFLSSARSLSTSTTGHDTMPPPPYLPSCFRSHHQQGHDSRSNPVDTR